MRNIEHSRLCHVLGWYNSDQAYRYATGLDGPVTLEILEDKLDAINASRDEFFLGIYTKRDDKLVGVVTGGLVKGALWIKLLAVAPEYRRTGTGSSTVALLTRYFREMHCIAESYLSVAGRNEAGILFWLKNGYREAGRLEKRVLLNGAEQSIIIMKKVFK